MGHRNGGLGQNLRQAIMRSTMADYQRENYEFKNLSVTSHVDNQEEISEE